MKLPEQKKPEVFVSRKRELPRKQERKLRKIKGEIG